MIPKYKFDGIDIEKGEKIMIDTAGCGYCERGECDCMQDTSGNPNHMPGKLQIIPKNDQ